MLTQGGRQGRGEKREAQKVVYLLPQHPLSIRKAPEEEDWPKQQQLWGRTDVAEFSRTRSVALLVCENKKESNRLVCTNNFLDPSRCNLYGVYISPTLPIFCQFYCLTQEGEKKRRRRDSSSKKRALAKGGEEVH